MTNISWNLPDPVATRISTVVLRDRPKDPDFTGSDAAWVKKCLGQVIWAWVLVEEEIQKTQDLAIDKTNPFE